MDIGISPMFGGELHVYMSDPAAEARASQLSNACGFLIGPQALSLWLFTVFGRGETRRRTQPWPKLEIAKRWLIGGQFGAYRCRRAGKLGSGRLV